MCRSFTSAPNGPQLQAGSFPQSQQHDTISCDLSQSQNTNPPARESTNRRQRHAPIPADGLAGYLYHHQPNRRAHGRQVEPRQDGMPKQACLDSAMQRLDTPMTAKKQRMKESGRAHDLPIR